MIEIPWPPSVNHYWRSVRGKVIVSREGRDYRQAIIRLALVFKCPRFGSARLKVSIDAFPPDRRRRDLDNTLKAIFDSLQAAGVYDDDGQIDDIHIRRGETIPGGSVKIELVEVEPGHGPKCLA